jgi:hypothetical protein
MPLSTLSLATNPWKCLDDVQVVGRRSYADLVESWDSWQKRRRRPAQPFRKVLVPSERRLAAPPIIPSSAEHLVEISTKSGSQHQEHYLGSFSQGPGATRDVNDDDRGLYKLKDDDWRLPQQLEMRQQPDKVISRPYRISATSAGYNKQGQGRTTFLDANDTSWRPERGPALRSDDDEIGGRDCTQDEATHDHGIATNEQAQSHRNRFQGLLASPSFHFASFPSLSFDIFTPLPYTHLTTHFISFPLAPLHSLSLPLHSTLHSFYSYHMHIFISCYYTFSLIFRYFSCFIHFILVAWTDRCYRRRGQLPRTPPIDDEATPLQAPPSTRRRRLLPGR